MMSYFNAFNKHTNILINILYHEAFTAMLNKILKGFDE